VAQAVGQELAHDQLQLVGPAGAEPRGQPAAADRRPGVGQRRGVDVVDGGLLDGRAQRGDEVGGGVAGPVAAVRPQPAVVPADHGMAGQRLVEDRCREGGGVVRAHQVPGAPGEGQVEQLLVALALDELRRPTGR
jgi:hypothetical protein